MSGRRYRRIMATRGLAMLRNLSVCRVTQALYPYVTGGSPVHCHELSQHQSSNGYKVTVLTVRYSKNVFPLEEKYDLRLFDQIRMPWDLLNMSNPVAPRMWLQLLTLDFDILHAHSHLFLTTLLAVLIARIRSKPVVVTVHGVRAVRGWLENLSQEIWLRTAGRFIFSVSDMIICLTEADAKEIRRYRVQSSKIAVVPNAVNPELFAPSSDEDPVILWVGRFVEEKGLSYLVEAAERFVGRYPNHKIVLVGDGPLKATIRKEISERGLLKYFEFRKSCNQQRIAQLMGRCKIFVLPSLKEGFPKSLLEAMASSKPVVATNNVRDIVDKAGITVPSANARELERAITTLLDDDKLRDVLGSRGREIVQKCYSWKSVLRMTEKVYEKALSRRSLVQSRNLSRDVSQSSESSQN